MIVFEDIRPEQFRAWAGGKSTLQKIVAAGKSEALNDLIIELYPDGIEDTTLNDLLWFEEEWIFDALGMEIEY